MSALTVYLDGLALIGPGLPDWATLRAVLAGEADYVPARTVVPAPAVLPPAERRRTGAVVKLALAAGLAAVEAAGEDAARLPTVFASSGGDGNNCHLICEALASDDRLISPTRFHNSVTNAPSGYWGIATGAMAPSQVVSAYDGSFVAGLLESVAQVVTGEPRVLLIAYDVDYPEPLRTARNIPDAFGVAFVLSAERGSRTLAQLQVETTTEPADSMAQPALEALRKDIPAARSLPLLAALAAGKERVVLDYLDDLRLAVRLAA